MERRPIHPQESLGSHLSYGMKMCPYGGEASVRERLAPRDISDKMADNVELCLDEIAAAPVAIQCTGTIRNVSVSRGVLSQQLAGI